jgi:1,4-alpha-glucan branching enzyme
LLQYDVHKKLQLFVRELNRLYRSEPALFEIDFHYSGFEWVDFHDAENSVMAFLRRGENGAFILFCCNFTPVPRERYRFGVPEAGLYHEILNSDSEMFGGSNMGNGGIVSSQPIPSHGRPHSISITLPPLAVVAFRKRS